jgi:predicted transcriptional regulator
MANHEPIQGELQEQIMRALWRLEKGRVGEVRDALPKRHRSAYTTVQTVLNRLAERGLLNREREGKAIVYKPRVSEAEYLSGSLDRALTGISGEARRAAIAQLVGGLDQNEQREIQTMAREIARRRGKR